MSTWHNPVDVSRFLVIMPVSGRRNVFRSENLRSSNYLCQFHHGTSRDIVIMTFQSDKTSSDISLDTVLVTKHWCKWGRHATLQPDMAGNAEMFSGPKICAQIEVWSVSEVMLPTFDPSIIRGGNVPEFCFHGRTHTHPLIICPIAWLVQARKGCLCASLKRVMNAWLNPYKIDPYKCWKPQNW